jgi:HD-like signal output (HDOD) protein
MDKKKDLPPLPEILMKIEKAIQDVSSTNEDLAKLFEAEPILSGQLLTYANTALLGSGREKVNNMPDILLRLGSKMVLDTAFALNITNLFMLMRIAGFDQVRFWKHCFSVAILSDFISEKLNLSPNLKAVSYISGLVHDVGILVFINVIPEEYSNFIQDVSDSSESIEVLEKENFGIAHPELGALFIKKHWVINSEVPVAVESSDLKENKDKLPSNLGQVVSLANRIANSRGLSNGITGYQEELVVPEMIDFLGMTSEGFKELLENTRETVEQMDHFLRTRNRSFIV